MRLIAVALLAGTSLALAACGGSGDKSEEPTAAATDAAMAAQASPVATASAIPTPSPSASATPTPTPSASAKAAEGGMAAAAATPPVAFNQCKACHSVEKGDHGIGPSLAGIYGTKAGDIPGFEYSDAMKNSGLTWNAANLDKYLENPQKIVPGTKMSFAGLKDAAKRKAVIDYLKTL
jgi:cytochrome c2